MRGDSILLANSSRMKQNQKCEAFAQFVPDWFGRMPLVVGALFVAATISIVATGGGGDT